MPPHVGHLHAECELGFQNFSQPPARGSLQSPQHKTHFEKKTSSIAIVSTKIVESLPVEDKALEHMVLVQSQHANPNSSDTIQKVRVVYMLNKLSGDLELSETQCNTLASFWEATLHTLQGIGKSSSPNEPISPPCSTFQELDPTIRLGVRNETLPFTETPLPSPLASSLDEFPPGFHPSLNPLAPTSPCHKSGPSCSKPTSHSSRRDPYLL
jgi:hypothetical protein